jgi:hypothetical protein
VQDLENTENILTAHPSMKGISNTFICLTEEEQAAASQGELGLEAMKRKEEDYLALGQQQGVGGSAAVGGEVKAEGEGEGNKGYRKIWTKNFFIGLEIEKRPSEFFKGSGLGATVMGYCVLGIFGNGTGRWRNGEGRDGCGRRINGRVMWGLWWFVVRASLRCYTGF